MNDVIKINHPRTLELSCSSVRELRNAVRAAAVEPWRLNYNHMDKNKNKSDESIINMQTTNKLFKTNEYKNKINEKQKYLLSPQVEGFVAERLVIQKRTDGHL